MTTVEAILICTNLASVGMLLYQREMKKVAEGRCNFLEGVVNERNVKKPDTTPKEPVKFNLSEDE